MLLVLLLIFHAGFTAAASDDPAVQADEMETELPDESAAVQEDKPDQEEEASEVSEEQTLPAESKMSGETQQPAEPEEQQPSVYYSCHGQDYGWQAEKRDGEMAGRTGSAKRLEAVKIRIEGTELTGSVRYQAHVQDYGWRAWSQDSEICGTTGESRRIEAVRVQLTGQLSEQYDIYYRVHIQNFGWLGWAKNGEMAGSSGLAHRVEAIEIRLVKSGEAAPGSTNRPAVWLPDVSYRSHVQDYGWRGWCTNGQTSGSVGESRRMEALQIQVSDKNLNGSIRYRTHVQYVGWTGWSDDGVQSGTTGKARRVEALQVKLTGQLAQLCDIYYRAYVQDYGWLGWAKNGETAGTEGLALRVEAFQIKLVAKGNANIRSGGSSKMYSGPGFYQMGAKTYFYASNGNRITGTQWVRNGSSRYYLKNGVPVKGWNYIDGLKYYFDKTGKLVQNVDSLIGVQPSYEIRVNKQMNCITVYAKDGNKGYIIPVKAMLCSTGDDTPLGTFYTPAKYRWREMFNGTYAQFATRLTAGQGFLFHSVTYSETNNRTLITEGYNGLGVIRSAGCIRLVAAEAYWIYTRCPLGTRVVVYNSSVAGPFDRPTVAPIPKKQNYDPTDPFL